MIIDILSWVLILTGVFFNITAALGLFRLPDFYTRIHGAGVADTLGAAFILIGLMLSSGFNLVTVKLILILLLLWYTSPIASHCLVKAARQTNLIPFLHQLEPNDRNTD